MWSLIVYACDPDLSAYELDSWNSAYSTYRFLQEQVGRRHRAVGQGWDQEDYAMVIVRKGALVGWRYFLTKISPIKERRMWCYNYYPGY